MLRRLLPALAALVFGAGVAWAQAIPLPVLLQGNVPGWVTRAGGIPAAVDLDFANGRWYQQGQPGCTGPVGCLSTSRASVAYEDDLSGNWIAFPANTPRVTNKGLLVEESRTNSIRNSTMQGAVAGSPGTVPTNWAATGTGGAITRTVVGTGTENGVNFIDIRWQFSGAGNADVQFEQANQISASTGQVWSGGNFATIVGGSTINVSAFSLILAELNNTQGFLASSVTNISPGSFSLGSNRFSQTRTLNQATTAFVDHTFRVTATGVADVTIRYGWPQLELGSFATSPIPTTSGAVTRAADVATLIRALAFGGGYSLYGAASFNAPTSFSGANQFIVQVDDGTPNNRALLFRELSTGNAAADSISGAVISSQIDSTVWAQGATGKIALSVAAGAQAASFNAGTVGTTAGSLPIGVNAARIGSNQFGQGQTNGYITRLAIWPTQALSAAQLQALTR